VPGSQSSSSALPCAYSGATLERGLFPPWVSVFSLCNVGIELVIWKDSANCQYQSHLEDVYN
jgi:hypothetical protein